MMRHAGSVLVLALLAGCVSTEPELSEAQRGSLVRTHVQLANGYLQRGRVEIARENLEKALALEPDDPDANNMMGVLQWRLKEHAAAERHFKRAVRGDRKNAEAQNNYGAFLCERGRVEEAETWFRRASENPMYRTPARANENAGLCFFREGSREKAERYFREALRLNPRLPASLLRMARITFESGRALSARGFIERYFQVAPDTPEALLLAVQIERALKNKDQEASYAVRLRGKFPSSPEAEQLNKSKGGKG